MSEVVAEVDFKVIPIRVVVDDIFGYIMMSSIYVKKEGEDDKKERLSFFGYFERDFTRKIFQLFSSIYLNDYGSIYYFDLKRTKSLVLEIFGGLEEPKSVMKKIVDRSTELTQLESIWVRSRNNDATFLFSEKDCYPNLKHLYMSFSSREDGIDSSEFESTFWPTLRSLHLQFRHTVAHFSALFNKYRRFPDLRKLSLSGINLDELKEPLFLPKLDILKLTDVPKFRMENGGKSKSKSLEFFECWSIPIMTMKNIVLQFSETRRLFTHCDRSDNNMNCFFDVSKISSSELTRHTSKISDLSFSRFSCQVNNEQSPLEMQAEILKLGYCDQEAVLSVLSNNFPKLKVLEFSEVDFSNPLSIDSFSNQLKEFKIYQVGMPEDFFRHTSWDSLKKLTLWSTSSHTEKYNFQNWSSMENLEYLKIISLDSFVESFFENMKFTKLVHLEISSCRGFEVNGKGWSHLGDTLKSLKLGGCKSFNEKEFSKVSFRCLEKLILSSIDDFVGEPWNRSVFENVKKLVVQHCKNLNDSFFQKVKWESLEDLSIHQCYKVLGEKWLEMEKLKKFNVYPNKLKFENKWLEKFKKKD